jgi:putative nucleotidyltransferase with HDIG domain
VADVEVDEELWFGNAGEEREIEARAAESMAAVAARVLGAKPFPAAAKRLEELTRSPNARIEQVVSVLESDPGLSMRLLRLVNSAGYALRVRCTSVRHAAALVGMRRLHQLATTAAILDMFETDNPLVVQLLTHSAVVGALSRYLAVHIDLPPDELFTCGFLHDIGKLMLLDAEGDSYGELVRQAGDRPDVLHVLERERYGFDHAVLGAHVLKKWKIPNPVPRVVAWHHSVGRAYQSDTQTVAMVQALRLADQVSYLLRTTHDAEAIKQAAESDAARYLEISEAQLGTMWQDLRRLTLRIGGHTGQSEVEIIPRKDSVPPSLRPKHRRSSMPGHSLMPREGASLMPSLLAESNVPVSIVPKHFACVVCKKASFGARCPICSGGVCPEHQVGTEQWCAECAAEYGMRSNRPPKWARWTTAGVAGGAAMLSFIGAALASDPSLLDLLVGPALIGALCVLLGSVGWRVMHKRKFISQRGHVLDDDPIASVPEAAEQAEAQPSIAGSLAPPQPSIPAQPRLPFGLSVPSSPLIAMRSEIPAEYMVNSMPVGADRLSGFATVSAPAELRPRSESSLPASESMVPLAHANTELGQRGEPATQRGAEQLEIERAEAQAKAERLANDRKVAEEAAQRADEEERLAAEAAAARRQATERAEEEQLAETRAAAEKAEAGRLAAARAAVEKAEAERVAAERALAEKIEAERAAAERVAAEQAAAERAAARAEADEDRISGERETPQRPLEAESATANDLSAASAEELRAVMAAEQNGPTSMPAPAPLKSNPAAPLLSRTATSPPATSAAGACTVPPPVSAVPAASPGHDDASAKTPVYNTALPADPARCRPPTIPPPNLNACTPGRTRAA